MNSIYLWDKQKDLNQPEKFDFTAITSSIYLIQVAAITKDKNLLQIAIDNQKLDPKNSFSGRTQQSRTKNIYILLPLGEGKHIIDLTPNSQAFLSKVEVFNLAQTVDQTPVELTINNTAEDGDRRSWITFILVQALLSSFTVELTLKNRLRDSDDVKVIVDGTTQRSYLSSYRKLWYFIASKIRGKSEDQTATFTTNLPTGTHYLELWADRMPVCKKISFTGLSFSLLEGTSTPSSDTIEVIKDKIRQKAKEYNFDSEMILRLVQKESTFDPDKVSPAGAKGLFQLQDEGKHKTTDQIRNLGFDLKNVFDVDQNIGAGLFYLNWLHEMYKNDPEEWEKTLAAWNWGMANASVNPTEPLNYTLMPAETKGFINFILGKSEN